ncbi:MAG TPA: hypothetical protein VIA62_28385 [Thermoanaerobaculia bacterium]|jgi:hypothetical protein|nr:hypothetical protein [Thermoanaerobaculia bacterium]
MRKKLTYLGLGLALTIAALAAGVQPAAAGTCVTTCDPFGCCDTCCQIGTSNKWICTERPC